MCERERKRKREREKEREKKRDKKRKREKEREKKKERKREREKEREKKKERERKTGQREREVRKFFRIKAFFSLRDVTMVVVLVVVSPACDVVFLFGIKCCQRLLRHLAIPTLFFFFIFIFSIKQFRVNKIC